MVRKKTLLSILLLGLIVLSLGCIGSGNGGGSGSSSSASTESQSTSSAPHTSSSVPTTSSLSSTTTSETTSSTSPTQTTTTTSATTTTTIPEKTTTTRTTTTSTPSPALAPIDFSKYRKKGEVIGNWRSIFTELKVYTPPEYGDLVKHYLPNATVEDISTYKAGIAVVPPEIGLKLLASKPVRVEKVEYFGYIAYRNGYHFVGPDKGIIAFFNSNDGPRLVVTGTSKAGVGLALRELSRIRGYEDVPSFYVTRSGQFEGLVFKEIGDVDWDGVVDEDEFVEDYPIYYDEPFHFYWRVVKGENVTVTGGFIRLVNGTEVHITALGFNVSVSIKNSTGVELTYFVENVNPAYLNYPEGAEAYNTTIVLKTSSGFSITPKPVSNYTVIAFGDHRPAHKDDPVPEVFVKIVNMVNNASPVFVIDNGDLVYSGRLSEWIDLMRVWHWEVPIFIAPGNHEYQGEGKNIYHYLFGPSKDFAFSLGNFTYIFVDNVENGYTLSSDQWEFIEEKLAEANMTGRRPVIVAHAPPYDPRPNGDHTMNHNAAEKLLSLMRQYNAFGIFSHIHMNWYGEYEGVPMIIAGGAGAPLYVTDPAQGGFYGYAVLEMGADGSIGVNFVRVE